MKQNYKKPYRNKNYYSRHRSSQKKKRGYIANIYRAFINMVNHDGIEHAGYMAFMNMLSLMPFIVFIVAIAGFFGDTQSGIVFIDFLLHSVPSEFIEIFKPRINEIMSGPPQGLLTVSIIGVIWTASSSVEGLRTILNRVYHVKAPPAYILRRLMSIFQFILLTILIILAVSGLVFVPILAQKLGMEVGILNKFDNYRLVFLYSFLFLVVLTLYYVIPNTKLKLSYLIPGAVLVIILWVGAGQILSFYISEFKQVSIVYGGLGGIIASMLFFFFVNMIFIYGAELNYLLYQNRPFNNKNINYYERSKK